MATPLAWLSLTHDRRRFLASAAGVAFAILLMWVELGFLHAIYDSTTRPIEAFDAELVLVSTIKDNTNPSKPFPRAQLARARAVPGVEEAVPVYLSRWGTWRGDATVKQDKVRVLGVDPSRPSLRLPAFEQQRALLQRLDTALFDQRHRDSYGGTLGIGGRGEINGHRLELVGDFELGPDLEMNATLVVSERTFARLFHQPGRADPLENVDFGLVQLEPGASVAATKAALEGRLGPHVAVLTPGGLIAKIHRYWTRNKPAGAVFGLGVLVGFVIGVVICYQILYTDILDHLPQFATLLAMGYSGRRLTSLAIARGLYLALAATLAAAPLGVWIYGLLAEITGLTFRLSALRAALVATSAAVMCVLASLLAMRRAMQADPAELF